MALAPAELVDEIVAPLSEFPLAGQRALFQAFTREDLRDVLPCIAVPTLLQYGDKDVRASLSVAEDLHAKSPRSELVVMSGVGHASNMEAAERFNSEVRSFLRSVEICS